MKFTPDGEPIITLWPEDSTPYSRISRYLLPVPKDEWTPFLKHVRELHRKRNPKVESKELYKALSSFMSAVYRYLAQSETEDLFERKEDERLKAMIHDIYDAIYEEGGNKSFLARRLADAHPDRMQRVLLRVFIGCDIFTVVCEEFLSDGESGFPH
ncbi:hypothetical protein FRD01_14655 [Microvenator marinus]|uniref:Uncharacterized protein n=1 Tax=Microvenator marinus TaxID=2600177 RepID=A0A5B8XWH1_9DELT|nr:hypothetical protein [Microvenator marinus]QED28453.1 hypothetical protein FRD01_14655 [Microvenator marinus]